MKGALSYPEWAIALGLGGKVYAILTPNRAGLPIK